MKDSEYEIIEPVGYQPPARPSGKMGSTSFARRGGGGRSTPGKNFPLRMIFLVVALIVVAAFVLVFNQLRSVQFELSPDTAHVVVLDDLYLPLGNRFLMFPGTYEAELSAPGYEDRLVRFEVGDTPTQTLGWQLVKKPGALDIVLVPSVAAEVFLNEKPVGHLPGRLEHLLAGDYKLGVRAKGYLPFKQGITIVGKGMIQTLRVTLEKPQEESRPVPPPKNLEVITRPAGAAVSVNGRYRGLTPVTLAVKEGGSYRLVLLKPGYRMAKRTARVVEAKKTTIQVELEAVLGTVVFDLVPNGAKVWVGGKKRALDQNHSLRLPVYPQELTLKAPGYIAQTHTVTPDEKLDKTIRAKLVSQTLQQLVSRKAKEKKLGFDFVKLYPNDSFSYETGRRTHLVRLSKAFAISKTEVTNAHFRHFRNQHSSGTFKSHRLDGAKQPVVNISWEDAALFANWLSRQAQIEPFYVERDGHITGFNAQSSGYRLPSEAEWVWVVRSKKERQYVWGDRFYPIPTGAGNYADKSAKDLFSVTLPSYNDRQPVSAAVGSFRPNKKGLYDLGGNVAEWIHDVFQTRILSSSEANGLEKINPLGQKHGNYHVIRGASWSFGSKKKLALAYREYNSAASYYVGFRLAHYLDGS